MTVTALPVLAVLVALLALPVPASAQYKVTGPDGRVTYTDRPPLGVTAVPIGPGAAQRSAAPASGAERVVAPGTPGAPGVVLADLPYDLRAVVQRFPVVLLAGDNCVPCELGRAALRQRGIPFVERSVRTREDLAALRRQEGGTELPVLRVAAQRLMGFDGTEWMATLDAAGYPAVSALSSRYRAPQVTALAPPAAPGGVAGAGALAGTAADSRSPTPGTAGEAAPAPAEPPRPSPDPVPSPGSSSSPPGFRF